MTMSMLLSCPFQLLEVNIISAQDLAVVSKSMKVYAVAWLNPGRKLTTQIDSDGHDSPTWNEKFVFRVDDDFLNNEDSTIMIEIYASAWLRDVLIGTVGVLVSNLLPRTAARKSKVSFVALQVRRPSGRPQGILNIGINLVDATKRSMPMYSELSASAVGYWDVMDPKKNTPPVNLTKKQTPHSEDNNNCKLLTLQRSQSEKNDSTINDYAYSNYQKGCDDEGGDSYLEGSEIGMPVTKKGYIMNMNGSLCSDVGPSPSVVAAAIARGLYPLPMAPPRKTGHLVFESWPEKEEGAEGLNTKIDRWQMGEVPAVYDHLVKNEKKVRHSVSKKKGHQRKGSANGGLFSCFGTAMGCEFTITCGGGNPDRKKRREGGNNTHLTAGSELTYDDQSYL